MNTATNPARLAAALQASLVAGNVPQILAAASAAADGAVQYEDALNAYCCADRLARGVDATDGEREGTWRRLHATSFQFSLATR